MPRLSKPSPLSLVALVLVGGGLVGMLRERGPAGEASPGCDPVDPSCVSPADPIDVATSARGPGNVLNAVDVCIDVGYLCAELANRETIRLQRWKDFEGTVIVHVPLPIHEEPAIARDLQRAAAQGLQAWNGQPFPILADLRGDRGPHFEVKWSTALGGSQIGVARTKWSQAEGLTVVAIELTTRSPFNGRTASALQVRLTAAHEMGHALGLLHSNSPRDVMYPSNTATSMSAQDYRTIEVLYRLDDGTQIRR